MKSKNKFDPNDPINHRVRNGGPGAALTRPTVFPSMKEDVLVEDSPLEGAVGGHNRHAKLMSPETRDLVLHSRRTEIDKFAEDRGLNPTIVFGIAEAAMRLGKVPDLRQYGIAGDEAKAIKHFVAGEILNIAIEDEPAAGNKTVAENTASSNMGATMAAMRLGSSFMERGPLVDAQALDSLIRQQEASVPSLALGTGVSDKPALTINDMARLANDDAARLLRASEAGLPPTQESAEGPKGESPQDEKPKTEEASKVAKPKGERIGKALKGLGGKLRSPAEIEPGQFNSANGGTAPLPAFDITVGEGISTPSARVLRESRVGAATLRESCGAEMGGDEDDAEASAEKPKGKLAFLKKFAKK